MQEEQKIPPRQQMSNIDAEILSQLWFLRFLSTKFKGGYQQRCSLEKVIDMITNTGVNSQGALYYITSYRLYTRQFYANGLNYQDVKKF